MSHCASFVRTEGVLETGWTRVGEEKDSGAAGEEEGGWIASLVAVRGIPPSARVLAGEPRDISPERRENEKVRVSRAGEDCWLGESEPLALPLPRLSSLVTEPRRFIHAALLAATKEGGLDESGCSKKKKVSHCVAARNNKRAKVSLHRLTTDRTHAPLSNSFRHGVCVLTKAGTNSAKDIAA